MISKAKALVALKQELISAIINDEEWAADMEQRMKNRLLDDHGEEPATDRELDAVSDAFGAVARLLGATLKPGERI